MTGTIQNTKKAHKPALQNQRAASFVQPRQTSDTTPVARPAGNSTLANVQGETARTALGGPGVLRKLAEMAQGGSDKKLSQAEIRQTLANRMSVNPWYSFMSDQDKAKFVAILEASQENGKLNPDMLGLLRNGKLMAADRRGGRVLDHMAQLAQQPLAEGVDRAKTLKEIAGLIQDPQAFNQDRQGTCTVTTIGRRQLQENPAEFVRLMVGLTSPEGGARTRGGDRISRKSDSLNPADRSGRTQVERIYQDALMELGNRDSQTYLPLENRHHDSLDPSFRKFVGLSLSRTELVAESVLGHPVETRETNGNSKAKLEEFQQQVAYHKSQGKEMIVGLSWGEYGHALTVYDVKDGYVYLNNPWGYGEVGQGDVPREVVQEGGRIRMTLADFLNRLEGYHAVGVCQPS